MALGITYEPGSNLTHVQEESGTIHHLADTVGLAEGEYPIYEYPGGDPALDGTPKYGRDGTRAGAVLVGTVVVTSS